MRNGLVLFAAVFVALLTVSTADAQGKIGVKFIGGRTDTPGLTLAADAKAGVPAVAQSHWNCVPGASGTGVALKSDDGADTTVTVDFKCPATWSAGNDTSKGSDFALTDGYLDSNSDSDAASTPTITVSKIPYSTYDVYVYFNTDQPGKHLKGSYKLGAASLPVLINDTFQGKYLKSNATTSGDYVVFSKVTGSSFTLTAIPISSDDGFSHCVVCAVQILKH